MCLLSMYKYLSQPKQVTMSDNEQAYIQAEEQQPYEEEYPEWEEDVDYNLVSAVSEEKPYNVYPLEKLTDKIYQENQDKCVLTCLPPEWNLMLYSFCEFNSDELNNVIDQEQTGRRMIRYEPDYEARSIDGECPICCVEDKIIKNPCGHAFCVHCWKNFLEISHTDRNNYELFPMCPQDGCFHRTNLLLMQRIWEQVNEPHLKAAFESLLCNSFARKSDRVKLCRSEGCNRAILINMTMQSILVCDCGSRICRFCGEQAHFPLNCSDLKAWSNIVSKKQNQWLNQLVTQQCPMCKTSIDKNGGCIHMTCRCKYQFCWICLKVWKGHTSYGACNSIQKEDHEKRLIQEQKKKKQNEGEYSVRFQEAKSEVERADSILKRVQSYKMDQITKKLNEYHILTNDTSRLIEFRDIVAEVFQLYRNCQIYSFFQLQGCKLLQLQIQVLSNKTSALDDYLTKKLLVIDQTIQIFNSKQQILKSNNAQLMTQIRQNFFEGKNYHLQELRQVRNIYEEIKSGQFMGHIS